MKKQNKINLFNLLGQVTAFILLDLMGVGLLVFGFLQNTIY